MNRLQCIALVVLLVLISVSAPGLGRAERGQAGFPGQLHLSGLSEIVYGGFEAGKSGGTFVTSLQGSGPRTFNRALAREASSVEILDRLYAPLIRRNQMTLEWEPALAESWKIGKDQRSVDVTLRHGLSWSDGIPLTAQDVVDTVNKIYLARGVESAFVDNLYVGDFPSVWEYLDDYHFRVSLPSVYAGILDLISIPPLPMHLLDPMIKNDGPEATNRIWGVGSDPRSLVVSGPFLISDYDPGRSIELIPNPFYYERDANGNRLPYLERVVIHFLPDQNTQRDWFLAGKLDHYVLRGEDYSEVAGKKKELRTELYNVGPQLASSFIAFNMNPVGVGSVKLGWLSNREFRRALASLVDRRAIIDRFAYGFGYPQYSFIPRISPYYWKGADEAAVKYDPERAKAILDALELRDRNGDGIREDLAGNEVTLSLATNAGSSERESIARLFAEEAQKVGVEIEVQPVAFNVLVGKLLSTFDWEMMETGLSGSIDPIGFQNVFPSSGSLHLIEPNQKEPRREWERKVDAAWARANETTNEADRIRGFEEVQRIWIDEVPWVSLYTPARIEAFNAGLGNVKPHPVSGLDWDGILPYLYFRK